MNAPALATKGTRIDVKSLSFYYGQYQALKDI